MSSKALDASANNNGHEATMHRKLSPGPGLAAREVAAHQLARIHEATIQIVAERGYKALKVRDVVRLAEVSTRAFYEHFGSKEDCFLQAYEMISRRATRRIIGAQAGARDWRERPRLVFERFARELEREPEGGRLALIEVYAAGEASLVQAWRAERIFEGMLAESFARIPGGIAVPPLVVEGMVSGIASIARNRLLTNTVAELPNASSDLVDWALSYPHQAAAELISLDRQTVWRDTTLEPLTASWVTNNGEAWPSTGDRALILAAVAEVAVKSGYAGITAPRVRSAAGVSRRKFDTYFDGLEDCYLAAIELRASEAMAQAARAQSAARGWAGGVYRAIAALCDHVAEDEFLARVCFADDFPPGPDGNRVRQRLIDAVTELLNGGAPRDIRPTPLVSEALTGALWSLFHHHIIRDWSLRRQIAATLAYLALAPAIGAPSAVAAIQVEQRI